MNQAMAHITKSAFENAATAAEFEELRQAAIEEAACDPENEHLDTDGSGDFATDLIDNWLQNLGLIDRCDTLRAEAMA